MKLFSFLILIFSLAACSSSPGIHMDPLGFGMALIPEETKKPQPTKETLQAEIEDKKIHLSLLQEQIFHELYSGHIQELETSIFDLEAQKAELVHENPKVNAL